LCHVSRSGAVEERDTIGGMSRLGFLVMLAALLSLTIVACHEEFTAPERPDLLKDPETFGFDLSQAKPDLSVPDLSIIEEHPDLAKIDAT
jgi:hypothetical protein